LGRRVGLATVRFTVVGVTSRRWVFRMEISLYAEALLVDNP
jgi:hypothetical protein